MSCHNKNQNKTSLSKSQVTKIPLGISDIELVIFVLMQTTTEISRHSLVLCASYVSLQIGATAQSTKYFLQTVQQPGIGSQEVPNNKEKENKAQCALLNRT